MYLYNINACFGCFFIFGVLQGGYNIGIIRKIHIVAGGISVSVLVGFVCMKRLLKVTPEQGAVSPIFMHENRIGIENRSTAIYELWIGLFRAIIILLEREEIKLFGKNVFLPLPCTGKI